VECEGVKLRYSPAGDLVLKGMNVNIKGAEKVGVVGRTGAGKSTLANALTRIVPICGGSIKFDGVDINEVNIDHVRESITIIPQESVLFKGTMRFNLDPTGKCTDKEMQELLIEAEMDKVIFKKKEESDKKKKELEEKMTNKDALEKAKKAKGHMEEKEDFSLLEFKIEGGGGNLSSGEKALICICRAILRKTKVCILDEATAAIDLKTEQLVQKLVDKKFRDSSMIVIAHRLQTIIKSDKVLVLGAGLKKEFGAPNKLLANPKSHFSKLCAKMKAAQDEEEEKKKKEKEEEEKKKKEEEAKKKK
jgi:ABC-type multidrug transport system fused ATPase/permease subunit